MQHEDDRPLERVPPMMPPPDEAAETVPPPATTKTEPAEAAPDRTDEILAAIAGLGATLESVRRESVERDTALADAILNSNHAIRDEINVKLDSVAFSAKKALEAAEECRKELKQSHVWLDEWARGTASDLDRRFDRMTTEIAGILREVSKDVTALKTTIATVAEIVLEHKEDFSAHAPLVEKLAQRSYDLAKGDDDERDRETLTGLEKR